MTPPTNDELPSTKATEAQALMVEIEQKNQGMRIVGLFMLGVTSLGVIIAVILGTVVYIRQSHDRNAEVARREVEAKQGAIILQGINEHLNNVDKNLAEHVGKEPLPPLVLPTTVVAPKKSTTTTTVRRTTTTTSRPATTTTTARSPTSTTSQPPTTVQPPPTTTTTTSPGTCVGPVCIKGASNEG